MLTQEQKKDIDTMNSNYVNRDAAARTLHTDLGMSPYGRPASGGHRNRSSAQRVPDSFGKITRAFVANHKRTSPSPGLPAPVRTPGPRRRTAILHSSLSGTDW